MHLSTTQTGEKDMLLMHSGKYWENQYSISSELISCRAGDVDIPVSTLGPSYVAATGGALATALGLNATVHC